jgi:4-hydroxybutyrate CoA-transferase
VRPVRSLLVALLAALFLSSAAPVDAAPRGQGKKPAATQVDAVVRGAGKAKVKPTRGDGVRLGAMRAAATTRPEPNERTPAQAAGQIRPGAHVYIPIGHSVSKSVLKALTDRALKDSALSADNPIKIVGLTNVASRKLYEETGGKIIARSVFIGANNRDSIAEGRGEFVPTHLSRVPRLIRDGSLRVDVAIVQVSPPDKNGYVSLGPSTATTLAAIEKARTVIAEVNPNVPKTHGAARVHKSKLTHMVRSNDPLITVDPVPATDVDRRIAEHVKSLIPKNPTLQFGIGATTDAIAGALGESGRKDLKIHSEMISDGTMRLVQSGAVQGKVKYSFALGSKAMLDWMDDNKQLESAPSDIVNDPARLAKIDRLISINTALRVDLNGQANAQYVGNRYYSGIGGQQDFFRGAMMSRGGKAILVLPSTSTIKTPDGGTKAVSRIVMALGADDVVTTGMHDLQYVVTEHGVAHLEGKSTTERAEALISVAHPDFRPELRAQLAALKETRRQAVKPRAPTAQPNAPPAAAAVVQAAPAPAAPAAATPAP